MTRQWTGGALLFVLACGGSVSWGDDGRGSTGTDDGAGANAASYGGAGGSAGGEGGDEVASFCEQACASTHPTGCFDGAQCRDTCLDGAGKWPPHARDAFARCAATDSLCFITVQGCMLAHLDDDVPKTYRVTGAGLQAYEGATVHLEIDAAEIVAETVIDGGTFSLELPDLPTFDQKGPLALLYIDADDSGSCELDTDRPMAEWLTWNGRFDDIVYSLEIGPTTPMAEWVCDEF